jgi:oligoribonuclease NrnB/cAMP/cGMP phosphodiesterase (DHH superfamily)
MKIFYHNDLDGQCSARIIHDSIARGHNDVSYVSVNYEKDFPFDVLKDNERVFIVDYSIEPSEMKDLLEITKDVVWIDHHKTAIEKYEDFPVTLAGIREEGRAGCELTFEYLQKTLEISHEDALRFINTKEGKHYKSGRNINFINLIGDWDVWRFDFGDNTREFHYGLLGQDTHPESEFWERIKNPQGLNDYIQTGQKILNYEKTRSKEYIERFGYEVDFRGYRIYRQKTRRACPLDECRYFLCN